MTAYFSLPHLGAGSLEIENIGCYFFRLADAHGCSLWQLATHLSAWWRNGEGSSMQLKPFSVLGARALSMCGYGDDVQRLVNALSRATGVASSRAGTLLSLREVAARQARETLRLARAWCPACYEEDRQFERPLYDRLIWAIYPVKRCAIHQIALFETCPSCRRPQHYSYKCVHLDVCAWCRGSLLGTTSIYRSVARPTFGEALIHELVAAVSACPSITLRRTSMRAFYRDVRRELPKGDPLFAARSLGSAQMLPSLDTVLRMATTFNVSLLDFQEFSTPPTTRSLYQPVSLRHPVQSRDRAPPAFRRIVQRALTRALACQAPLAPYSHFCRALQISKGMPRYAFPELTARYLERRRREIARCRDKEACEARRAHKLIVAASKDYEIRRKKELEKAIAETAAVSIVLARKIIADLENIKRRRVR